MNKKVQIAVIGAGPGGYAAAFYAAGHGYATMLIDPEPHPGGTCLYRGCIPSKALLHVSRLIAETRDAEKMGLYFAKPQVDLVRMVDWKNAIVDRLTVGLGAQCTGRQVTYVQGVARFLELGMLEITPVNEAPYVVHYDHCIVATGGRPAEIAGLDTSRPGIMDSTQALQLENIPESLLVIGGGNIGLELGSVYAALGSRVTIMEALGGLLFQADRDCVRPLAKRLDAVMAEVMLNTRLLTIQETATGFRVHLENKGGESLVREYAKILVAAGRRANTDRLGLERIGLVTENGKIPVDAAKRTLQPNVFAIGDSIHGPMLAHKAAADARVAVDAILGKLPATRSAIVPFVTFTDPEVAWAGLTETAARQQGIKVQSVRFPWAASGRAHTLERTEGVTKLIFDPETEKLLGVGITGPGAGELIAAGVLALESGVIAQEMADVIHPHPTLSETLMEAAQVFLGHSVHFHAPRRKLNKVV